MRNSVQRHAILLAALLQILPLVRNFFTNPAALSNFAFILRWGVGTAAVVGAYDARSAASNYFTSTNTFVWTNGFYSSNNITILTNQEAPGAWFLLSNVVTHATSGQIISNQTSTLFLPPGLTFKCIDKNDNNTPSKPVYGIIFGTPTSTGTTNFNIWAGYQNNIIRSNLTLIVIAGSSLPNITNQPIAGATNLVGTTNTLFSVTAGGTSPLSYQWFFNTNTAVAGATNATLGLTNIQLTAAGYYRCTITNSAGSTNSANALLTVWQPPIITNNPTGSTNVAGGSAGFSVTAGGVPALNYQWVFNAATPQAGATSATFNLANLRASQSGNYSVVITNSAGAITSAPAALLVTNPLPPAASSPIINGANFQFTFNGIPGLTNTVQTNGNLSGGSWGVWTNLPPPANNNPITVINPPGQPNLFFRVLVQP